MSERPLSTAGRGCLMCLRWCSRQRIAREGMIFFPDMAKLVLSGRKTLTVRSKGWEERECSFKPGRAYAVQLPKRQSRQCLTVLEVRSASIGALGLRDLKRAGFRSRTDFRTWWDEHHPRLIYGDESEVWLIGFLLGDHSDQPRLLAAQPGPQRADYVSVGAKTLVGSAEEVPASYQAKLAAEAGTHATIARNAEYEHHLRRLRAVIDDIRAFRPETVLEGNLRGLERQASSLERKLVA
jgi:uncharacterized protein YqfB (UPF0267 family)